MNAHVDHRFSAPISFFKMFAVAEPQRNPETQSFGFLCASESGCVVKVYSRKETGTSVRWNMDREWELVPSIAGGVTSSSSSTLDVKNISLTKWWTYDVRCNISGQYSPSLTSFSNLEAAGGGDDPYPFVWKLPSSGGKVAITSSFTSDIHVSSNISAVSFCPHDPHTLISIDMSGAVAKWDTRQRTSVSSWYFNEPLNCIAQCPMDPHRIALGFGSYTNASTVASASTNSQTADTPSRAASRGKTDAKSNGDANNGKETDKPRAKRQSSRVGTSRKGTVMVLDDRYVKWDSAAMHLSSIMDASSEDSSKESTFRSTLKGAVTLFGAESAITHLHFHPHNQHVLMASEQRGPVRMYNLSSWNSSEGRADVSEVSVGAAASSSRTYAMFSGVNRTGSSSSRNQEYPYYYVPPYCTFSHEGHRIGVEDVSFHPCQELDLVLSVSDLVLSHGDYERLFSDASVPKPAGEPAEEDHGSQSNAKKTSDVKAIHLPESSALQIWRPAAFSNMTVSDDQRRPPAQVHAALDVDDDDV
eukprot:ANDGO_06833.mRNA.1 hypothetical protein